MVLRGFPEDRGSRIDVGEGGTSRKRIADTTRRQGNGFKSLQLEKMRECEWKGQSVNDVLQCFKAGKITEREKVGVTRDRRQSMIMVFIQLYILHLTYTFCS